MLELGIYFLGGLVLTIFYQLVRDFHWYSLESTFDGVLTASSCFKLFVQATENCK